MSREKTSLLLFLQAKRREATNAANSVSLQLKMIILHWTSKIAQGCEEGCGLFGLSVKSFPASVPLLPSQIEWLG